MDVSINNDADNCVIEVNGELDRETLTENLWEGLSSESKKSIEQAKSVSIDLKNVARGDTAGLAWLLNSIRDIRTVNTAVSVMNPPKKLLDLASLSNASQLITEQRGQL